MAARGSETGEGARGETRGGASWFHSGAAAGTAWSARVSECQWQPNVPLGMRFG